MSVSCYFSAKSGNRGDKKLTVGRVTLRVLIKGKWMRKTGIVKDSYVSVSVREGLLLIRREENEVRE